VIRLSVSAIVWAEGADAPQSWGLAPGARGMLLMQRSDNGHWGIPGGYVEAGETVVEATAREVFEETGVEIEVGRLIGVYSDPARQVIAYPDGNRVQSVNLCFEGRALGQGEATTPEETLAFGFFAPEAFPEPFVPIQQVRLDDALSDVQEVRVR